MNYIERKYKNPNGETVTIYVHELFNLAKIGAWAKIGSAAVSGVVGRLARITNARYLG